jgi:ketosteroid isomerase-like protein
MKSLLLLLFLTVTAVAGAQSKNEKAIRTLLHTQTGAWNRGDLEGFMQTYWQSDSLLFIGKSGVTRGWQKTLDNYKRGYPDKAAMGTLSFDIIQVKKLSRKYYYVTGKWMLQRAADAPSGHYTLLLRKISGAWKIVSDHSS